METPGTMRWIVLGLGSFTNTALLPNKLGLQLQLALLHRSSCNLSNVTYLRAKELSPAKYATRDDLRLESNEHARQVSLDFTY
jgi:hypothetical protein